MAVKVIKAKPKAQNTEVARGTKKLRVAAYCRVSTDMEEQESSYEAQCEHYTNYINSNPDWELAGIFADSGISGTSTKHREQFNKMIEACQTDEVDMVITKSISRFARNTLDCLKYIRLLKDLDIPVLFEKENINTLDAKGEILITIMASIAQQESQSISQNVRMGIQYRMQQGKGILNTESFLGFDKDEDGNLIIVPEEADLIRRIYREYLEGRSPHMIAQRLTEEGIPSPKGCKQWHPNTVRSMLQNEKYAGDLLMQKYYTESFLTHKLVKNNGKYPQYLVENHHDPIVPKEVFNQVQWEMRRRGGPTGLSNTCKNKLGLNGKLVCGICGSTLRHFIMKGKTPFWRCRKRGGDTKCTCKAVKDAEVEWAVVQAFRKLPSYLAKLSYLCGQLDSGGVGMLDMKIEQAEAELAVLEKQLADRPDDEELHELQAEKSYERDVLNSRRADISYEALCVRFLLELVEQLNGKTVEPNENPACADPEDFYNRTSYVLPAEVCSASGQGGVFSDDLTVRYIRAITVREDCFVVCFKGGVCIPIKR